MQGPILDQHTIQYIQHAIITAANQRATADVKASENLRDGLICLGLGIAVCGLFVGATVALSLGV
jgi:hypothetical protein